MSADELPLKAANPFLDLPDPSKTQWCAVLVPTSASGGQYISGIPVQCGDSTASYCCHIDAVALCMPFCASHHVPKGEHEKDVGDIV